MTDIREQIDSLLTGERRSLSVHEQWELSESLKKLLAVYEAAKEYDEYCEYKEADWLKLENAIAAVEAQNNLKKD